MANVNSRYSQSTPKKDRGEMLIAGNDGNCVDSFAWQENVENAHDQQGAPTNLLGGAVSRNAYGTPSAAPVADHSSDEYRAPFTRKPVHAWVVDADPGNNSDGAGN